jgi:phosphate acetyltransferase
LVDGDVLDLAVEVAGPAAGGALALRCSVRHADGAAVLDGTAEVTPPAALHQAGDATPFGTHPRRMIASLLERCRGLPPVPTAVAHPCDAASIEGALLAARHGLIVPILVGPEARIRAAASAAGLDLSGVEIVPAPHSHASAEAAVALIGADRAKALMKGSLHTDELLSAALAREAGLCTERRVSHAFVMDAPLSPRLLIITDAAINIAPDLEA